jgi:hypothetical protein
MLQANFLFLILSLTLGEFINRLIYIYIYKGYQKLSFNAEIYCQKNIFLKFFVLFSVVIDTRLNAKYGEF